jgi:integrase/recombinase XerD
LSFFLKVFIVKLPHQTEYKKGTTAYEKNNTPVLFTQALLLSKCSSIKVVIIITIITLYGGFFMYNQIYNSIRETASKRNLRDSTVDAYCVTIHHFMESVSKTNLDDLTVSDVETFLSEKRLKGIAPQTYNHYLSAIRFLYKRLLKIYLDEDDFPRMKKDIHLPVVLTKDEIESILNVTTNLKHKTMLATMYSAGLRVSELTHLHYCDISRNSKSIHVRDSKSRNERYTLLADRTLNLLTEYWFKYDKPQDILFPSEHTGSYIRTDSLNQLIKASAQKAGITKKVSSHCFRHSFASHLLESGCDIKYIQSLLGHRDPKSTEVYLHVSDKSLLGVRSPFDAVEVSHE